MGLSWRPRRKSIACFWCRWCWKLRAWFSSLGWTQGRLGFCAFIFGSPWLFELPCPMPCWPSWTRWSFRGSQLLSKAPKLTRSNSSFSTWPDTICQPPHSDPVSSCPGSRFLHSCGSWKLSPALGFPPTNCKKTLLDSIIPALLWWLGFRPFFMRGKCSSRRTPPCSEILLTPPRMICFIVLARIRCLKSLIPHWFFMILFCWLSFSFPRSKIILLIAFSFAKNFVLLLI